MAPDNQDREQERLAKLYAEMSEEGLREIAREAVELTDVARDALAREIDNRGLGIQLAAFPAGDEADVCELVTIARFRDLPEALLAKSTLESAGIECFLANDNMVRMSWFLSDLVGGARLKVKPEDVDAASAVLNQPIPEAFDAGALGEYRQPRCPRCESIQITFEALDRQVAYATAYLGIPLPIPRNSWNCESCGHRWEDLQDPPPEPSPSDEAGK